MNLEDQVRRMGEARATEVSTPSWRDRVGGGRGLVARWAVAAVAAVIALTISGVVVFAQDDDSDADVSGPNGSAPIDDRPSATSSLEPRPSATSSTAHPDPMAIAPLLCAP
jgi:hypothetical protein